MSLQDLTPEQIKKLQDAFNKHIEKETKKSITHLSFRIFKPSSKPPIFHK